MIEIDTNWKHVCDFSFVANSKKKSYLPPFARYFDAKIENLRFSFFTHPRDQSFELWSPPKSVLCDLGYWSKTRDPILLGYLTVKTRWSCVHYVFTWYRLVTDRQTDRQPTLAPLPRVKNQSVLKGSRIILDMTFRLENVALNKRK